jgi:hypothetical protein
VKRTTWVDMIAIEAKIKKLEKRGVALLRIIANIT